MEVSGRQVTLRFLRKELLYDIGNYSFVEGDIMDVDDEHKRHQTIDVCEDGNIDRVTRVLNLGYSEVVELLYPYTKRECPHGDARENMLVAPDVYVVDMYVPETFASSTVELLKNLIHEYLVCRVLADWMSITNPGSTEKWEEKMEDMRGKLRSCVNSRMGRLRRRLSPW